MCAGSAAGGGMMRKRRGHKHATASRFRARCCLDLSVVGRDAVALLLFIMLNGMKCSLSALLMLDADAPLFGGRRIGLPARQSLVLPLPVRIGDVILGIMLSIKVLRIISHLQNLQWT
jgi:hypothetical protein